MKLSKLREKKGWTQERLVRKIGVSRGLIAQVEVGDRRPYPSLKKRIAEVLGVPEEKIFK